MNEIKVNKEWTIRLIGGSFYIGHHSCGSNTNYTDISEYGAYCWRCESWIPEKVRFLYNLISL